jgi:hypothetical protein
MNKRAVWWIEEHDMEVPAVNWLFRGSSYQWDVPASNWLFAREQMWAIYHRFAECP